MFDRIIGTVMATVLGAPPEARTDDAIGGVAASGGVVEGIARVLSGPHEIR